jgi:hypothetical protein
MTVAGWLATLAGVAFILAAGRDVFHTLLHPSGSGRLSSQVLRIIWKTSQRLGARAVGWAGPIGIVSVIGVWTALLSVGWALIYLPHLTADFQYSSGVPARGGIAEAVYVSLVAMTTVGFGGIVAETAPLRLALVLEAMLGFALLTAAISWVLSIYPALGRRRSLAARIDILLGGEPHDRLAPRETPEPLALVLWGLVSDLATVRVDLVQYPAIYYFTPPDRSLDLPQLLPHLRAAVTSSDVPAPARDAADSVRMAIDRLVSQLASSHQTVEGDSPEQAVRSYALDHEPRRDDVPRRRQR